jgi:NTE family protein
MKGEPRVVTADPTSPVVTIEAADAPGSRGGTALCLSGGGYRAMVFHLGAVWRLNELGFLLKLDRVSSVSGGSITAATLGSRWSRLDFDARGVARGFESEVVTPVRSLAGRTIDAGAIVLGALGPGSIGDRIADAYRRHLFGGATLQDLPEARAGVAPRFVINASNVQSGALWRFMRHAMRDYRVGSVPRPRLELAVAVAASSAFPPLLSPVRLELRASDYDPPTSEDLHREPFTTKVALTDGGVYDNLGLETAWKRCQTILVSDGGGKMQAEAEPKGDWARHSLRVNELIDNQVRSLRKRQLLASFRNGAREGTYWGIRSDVRDYALPDALDCPIERTTELANLKTRLKRLEPRTQERLINWGYAVCDAAMRRHVAPAPMQKPAFPYPDVGV